MTFHELIEKCLDDLMPPPVGSRPLSYVTDRYILKAYLVTGSKSRASQILGIASRTMYNRLFELFPPSKIITLEGSRGRTDLAFLIEFTAQRMPRDMKLPAIAKASPVWRNNRIRGLALQRSDDLVSEICEEVTDDDPLSYPCHRDFEFWDRYMNLDHIKQHRVHGIGTKFREDLHGEA